MNHETRRASVAGRRVSMLLVTCSVLACAPSETPEEASLTAVGEPAPPIVLQTLAGDTFDLSAQTGKVVLLNFWATWCPPCRQEMPQLDAEVWQRFGERTDFAMVSIAREESAEVIAPFVDEHGYGWPFAPDVDRGVYGRYATAYIPRTYLIGRDGSIIYQGSGYAKNEFAAMVALIERQLGG